MVKVRLAALLHSYTSGVPVVEAEGGTLAEVMDSLDRSYPGLAFRVVDEQGMVRPHMSVFVGSERVRDPLVPVGPRQEIFIVGALSGG
ncbi:MAG: MoaD/ThiS family protein [Planctomycetota bacterium]